MRKRIYIQILLSAFLTAGLFITGFYVGQSSNSGKEILKSETATTTESIDLSNYWKAWKILDEKFAPASSTASKITDEKKIWGSIQGLASSYGDPYTVFFPPEESKEFEEEISGSFGGVGMEIDVLNGALTVVAPLKNTPAEAAGVLAGDKIIMIGDKSTTSMTSNDALKLIRGDIGTSVTITFGRVGEAEPLVKTITRDAIEIPTVDTELLPSGVFVIHLYNFSATSPNLFRNALREFIKSGSNKLVLDLRNNPGGYLEASLDMASWFLPTGKLVVTEDFGGKEEKKEYRSKGYDIFNDKLKFAILINEGSASASEILAGALRENGEATLIGQNTFGKGSVQELIDLTPDTSLKVTVAHWLTPLGNSISNGGLTPDIKVELTKENTANDKDPVLEKAVEYLTSQ